MKKKTLLLASTAALALGAAISVGQLATKNFAKSQGGNTNYQDITVAQLEEAMNGDGTFTVGSFDQWKAENITFYEEGGIKYAKLDDSSSLYSTSTAGEEVIGERKGSGYYAITLFDKKATASSSIRFLDEGGNPVYGPYSFASIASGDSDSNYVELPRETFKRLKLGEVETGKYLAFSKLRLHYNCEQDTGFVYKHNGVYSWRENIQTHELSNKTFISWSKGSPENGARIDNDGVGVSRVVSIWDGSSASSSLRGSGSESDPYQIWSAEDLAYFASTTAGGSAVHTGKFFKLMVTVDLADHALVIGGYANYFAGTFDGGDNSILGLKLTQSNAAHGTDFVALFPTLGDGSAVKNLTVDGSVTGNTYTAAFCGMANGTTIQNCYNLATVTSAKWSSGGFVGQTNNASLLIENCENLGTVSSTFTVASGLTNMGGIVGNHLKGTIRNCTNSGNVIAQYGVGSIIGAGSATVDSCTNKGLVMLRDRSGSFFDVDALVGTATSAHANSVNEGYVGNYSAFWGANGRKTPYTWNLGTPAAGVRVDTNEFGITREVSIWDGTSQSASLSGDGSSGSPYLINNANDLAYLAASTAGSSAVYSGLHIKLNANIDLGGRALVIGGWSNTFAGHFDGANNAILGLSLTTDNAAHNGEYIGLFPTMAADSSVRNLAVAGSVTGASRIGVISAIVNKVIITNIYNFANVTSTGTNVGGIVGLTNSGASGTHIENCVNFGSVSASGTTTNAGGVIGYLNALVQDCENYGDVEGKDYSGGVVGKIDNGTITGSKNYGYVHSTVNTIGGVAGDGGGTFQNCANYGEVRSSTGYTGGIIGVARSIKVTMTDCVNYGSISSSTMVGGIMGCLFNTTGNTFTNVVNKGTVTGTGWTGGLVGGTLSANANQKGDFVDCSNEGTITGANNQIGVLAGRMYGTYTNWTNTGTANGGTTLVSAGTMTAQ